MKHTPGPWQIDKTLWPDASWLIRSGKIGICAAWKTDDRIDRMANDEAAKANANLIAAAPTLKETNYILAVLSLQSDRYATDPEFRDAVDNALEADRVAEGR